MNTKFCTKCNVEKIISDFSPNKGKKDGLQTYCKDCKKNYEKEIYKNSAKRRKDMRDGASYRLKRNQDFIVEFLRKNPCIRCLEKDIVVLTFDHLRDKEFLISDGIRKGYSLNRLKKEIEKCQVLCANCHARKTAKDYNHYKFLLN